MSDKPIAKWSKAELVEQMESSLESFFDGFEADEPRLDPDVLLPVLTDVGAFIDYEREQSPDQRSEQVVYLFDLAGEHDLDWAPPKYRMSDPVDVETLYDWLSRELREQILNASEGQLKNYVRWGFNAMTRE